ncbi:hypothetical protein BCR39DRAFT_528477 [Naematelia encephala]|uniref:Histone deacetylase domain-containing protein n=1 Tax=Naematelia encephala TaxID=71784 RepID=A0A1Y2B7J6_9TREE|nr:hypothetical protein BCR39DRAFT_528477 [Naematelia encephala]
MLSPNSGPVEPVASSSTPQSRRVAYFYDPDVGNYVYYLGHPMKPHRIRMAHNLIVNYGLCDEEDPNPPDGARDVNMEIDEIQDPDGAEKRYLKALSGSRGHGMQVFRPRRATKGEMTRFHTDEYIDFLEMVTPETQEVLSGGGVRCLIGEDCPAFEGVFEFCTISAGGSLAAAEKLNAGACDIAINWAGGLHHAKKTEASGFCYVNDIVLGILELLRIHPRVLYIDVDVHHGDGVEEAFYVTDRVMTASFHRFGEFFPGTGDVKDVGMKKGKGYAVNVPLRDGITDETFHSIFKPVIQHIIDFFRPGAIVLQMGADSLAGDKLGGFNVTLDGHAECARFVKSFNIPVMMLGGGGYTTKNVARAWTNETAVMCGRTLSEDLPYNQYMEYYGPRYKLEVLPNNTDNHNPPEYIESIKRTVLENLRNLPHAPSAQLSQVPGKLSKALGLKEELSDPEDEIDARIRKFVRRRQMNGSYESSSSESEDDRPAATHRSRYSRQGGVRRFPARQLPVRRDTREESADSGEDPCGVRKKRTFFKSSTKGMILPGGVMSSGFGLNGNGNGIVNGIVNGGGLGALSVNGSNGLGGGRKGVLAGIVSGEAGLGSRAASPMSVV